jgi:predicted nucleic-acid-binding Zn-ribbon protein
VKKTSKCPKCGSTEIYKVEHGCIQPREFVEVGILSSIQVMRHICTQCGYVEEWIEPPPRLKELVQKKRKDGLKDLE